MIRARPFVTVAVPDIQPQEIDIQPVVETVAIEPSKYDPLKKFRSTQLQLEERVNAAYMLMLNGGSRRENCNQLAAKYNVSFRQAENYYAKAQELMRVDRSADRQDLLNQINNMRMHTIQKALKRGNLQVVAQLLDSLARAAGEGTAENEANNAPTLNITINEKVSGNQNSHSLPSAN